MAAEFVALADLLSGATRSAPPAVDVVPESTLAAPVESAVAHGPEVACERVDEHAEQRDALRDARLFRARLADAFDEAATRLLRELAAGVLARELRLAPCDLAALVRRAVERAPIVRVRVAPGDVSRIASDVARVAFDEAARVAPSEVLRVSGVPVVADGALSDGDAIIELVDGALDARLGVRLAAVLEAFA